MMLASGWRGVAIGVLAGAAAVTGVGSAAAHEVITAPAAPAAIGPYAHAMLANDTLYASGQLGLDPKSGALAPDVAGQTEQALRNLAAVLAAAKLSLDDVVMAHVYLADLQDYAAVNAIYARWFARPPARVVIEASRLPRDAKVEISAIAVRRPPAAARGK